MSKNTKNNFSVKGITIKASTDMVSAIIVGAGLGIVIDRYLESYPWGLIIGFLLGSAAGLLNVYRGLCKIGYGFDKQNSKTKDLDG